MRFAILIAAFGVVTGVPALTPSLSSAAYAQTADALVLTGEEQALQAQIVSLAQAGDTTGLKALIEQQVRAGRGASLARIARSVSGLAQSLAATDPSAAAALVNASVVVASNSSVSASDQTVAEAVGIVASAVAREVSDTDPAAAAGIQTNVAINGSVGMQIAFTTQSTRTEEQPTTPQFTTQTRPVVRRPVVPEEPVIPDIPEPNPAQTGSPV